MNYRKFGNTDLEVSEICFGPMRFSAKEPGSDGKSKTGQQALERALERGLNFIHSSYEYGTRWAIGQVLKDHPQRHDLHHIIKVPVPDFEDDGIFSADKFRLRVEEALRDLHTDHIAVLQHLQRARPNEDDVRTPDIPVVHEQLMETFEKLRDEGKVGYLTTFPYTPGFGTEALKTGGFSGVVGYYNLIEMEMAELFPQMEAQGQGFFCIRPFMAGLLTDLRADRSQLPAGDRFQDDQWLSAYKRLDILKPILGGTVDSWTAFAIKFALCHPIVTSLIVGLNSVEQVDSVLDAADGVYPKREVFDKALEILQAHGPVEA
ncbi:MAG: aryl-alcohol dehydrogenase-like predicted oxidoreductase [Candidatus Latescibacterota bacterium]|jgi:aryl-alcohol dehydrogenase-like predicted oxidoreductase